MHFPPLILTSCFTTSAIRIILYPSQRLKSVSPDVLLHILLYSRSWARMWFSSQCFCTFLGTHLSGWSHPTGRVSTFNSVGSPEALLETVSYIIDQQYSVFTQHSSSAFNCCPFNQSVSWSSQLGTSNIILFPSFLSVFVFNLTVLKCVLPVPFSQISFPYNMELITS